MKDDFNIIDLDQTDTIPSGIVEEAIENIQISKEIFEEAREEELFGENPDKEFQDAFNEADMEFEESPENNREELQQDEWLADEDYAEDGVFDICHENAASNKEIPGNRKIISQDLSVTGMASEQSAADEDYGPDAEPVLADVKIISDHYENADPLDIHSPEVFQGEVSVDTVFLKDLAGSIVEQEMSKTSDLAKDNYEGKKLSEKESAEDNIAEDGLLEEDELLEDELLEDELLEDELLKEDFDEVELPDDELEEDFQEDELLEDEEAYYDEDLEYIEEKHKSSSGNAADKKASNRKKSSGKKKSKKNSRGFDEEDGLFSILINKIRDFNGFDWAIAGAGIVVLIAAIVVLVVFTGTRRDIAETSNVYNVGNQIAGLGIAGESGLMAVTDMAALKSIPSQEPEEITEEVNDSVSENGIETKVTFTSVEQDLKIKFVNKETERLITNVLFEIHLKDSKGTETILKDEDLDGIIYEKPMKSGEYTVEIMEIPNYHFMPFDSTITVKEKIVYEQIEVKEEIKTEAEVNAAVEDTAINAAEQEQKQEEAAQPEENKLADTVEWVESTRTAIEGSTGGNAEYNQIDKNTINEPAYTSSRALYIANEIYASAPMNPGMQRVLVKASETDVKRPVIYYTEDSDPLANPSTEPSTEDLPAPIETEQPSTEPIQEPAVSPSVKTTETPTETPTEIPDIIPSENPTKKPTESPSETPAASPANTPTASPTETPDAESTTTPSPSPTATPAASPSSDTSAKISKVKLGESSMNLAPGASRTIIAYARMSDKSELNNPELFTYESEDTSVAKVDEKGKVTGVAEGKTEITVTYEDSYGTKKSAVCKITVSSLTVKEVKFEKTELVLQDGLSEALSVTAIMSDGSKITDAAKFSWESSKESVATVKAGEVTARDEGSTVVKATFTDGAGNSKAATCDIKVTKNAQSDTSTKLKDKNGNQVYIKDSNGNYVEAVYADYYSAGAFYQKVEVKYKYTGWQTLDGNVYFFDKNNNKVTGDQVIQGVKYHFTDDGILAMDKNGKLGIDVSKWNGNIDWNAVKNSGITYVIIRCGYRGSSSGVLVEDPTFKSNIKGATAAGLKVGVYFFTQAVNEVEAVEEASMCLSLVKGYGISYPIFIDTEKAGGRADGIDKNTRTAVCKAFCETIKNGGYTPGIYASKYWFYDNVNYNSLSSYRIWLAQYTSEPSFSHRYDLWQYSSKGSVSGIKGNVDMNWSYLGY